MADILAKNPDLTKVIKKAVERIGENHALARDNKGVEIQHTEIEEDRKEWRKTKVIEESLKAAADEMAEKMVLENTIDGMVKDVIQEQETVTITIGGTEYNVSKTVRDMMAQQGVNLENLEDLTLAELETLRQQLIKPIGWKSKMGDEINAIFSHLQKHLQEEELNSFLASSSSLEESTKDTIKKLVNKKLKDKIKITEASKVPGLYAYDKAFKESGKENKKYHKEFKAKLDKYTDIENSSHPEFPHQNNSKTDYKSPMYRGTTEDDEFVDDFAYPGLEDFDVHNQDMGRLTDYLEGSQETGNAMTDDDDKALGNVVPSDLGKKMLKSKKRRKEKIAAEKASMSNLRGYTPDVQKVKQIKESITTDIDKMKKLSSYNKITQ